MSFCIAVAGKGGSGKTSITSLIVRYLKRNGTGAILAVDADPNAWGRVWGSAQNKQSAQ